MNRQHGFLYWLHLEWSVGSIIRQNQAKTGTAHHVCQHRSQNSAGGWPSQLAQSTELLLNWKNLVCVTLPLEINAY